MIDGQIFAFVTACLLATVFRLAVGTWVHPAPIFAAAWTLFLAIPTFLATSMNPFPVTAWMVVGAIVATVPSVAISVRPEEVVRKHIIAARGVQMFVAAGPVAAVLSAVISQRANGISITSFDAVSAAARELTTIRYDGSGYTPPSATILLGLTYCAAIAAPFVASQARGAVRAIWTVAPASGGALYAVLTTARAPFLISAAITLSAWLTVMAITSGGRPRITLRSWVPLFFGGGAVLAVFSYVASSRRGGATATTTENLLQTISVYSGGSLPALDAWLPDAAATPQSFGAETFAGVAQFLLMDLSLGSARPDIADIGSGLSTNVYTSLRTLIEDFGLVGFFLVVSALALVSALAFRKAVLKGSVVGAVVVVGWGAFALFSQTTSIFGFANVCFAFFLAIPVLSKGLRIAPHPVAEVDAAIGGRSQESSWVLSRSNERPWVAPPPV